MKTLIENLFASIVAAAVALAGGSACAAAPKAMLAPTPALSSDLSPPPGNPSVIALSQNVIEGKVESVDSQSITINGTRYSVANDLGSVQSDAVALLGRKARIIFSAPPKAKDSLVTKIIESPDSTQ
jgi:hypothetical protein